MPRRLFWPFLKFLVPVKAGIPGHTVGVRQGVFPSSPPRSRLGTDPRVSPAGISTRSGLGHTGDARRAIHRPPRACITPGRPQSCAVDFRHHLGSMLKGLGSTPEHTIFFSLPNHGNEVIHFYFKSNANPDSRPGVFSAGQPVPPASQGKAVRCSRRERARRLQPRWLRARDTHQCCTHRLCSPRVPLTKSAAQGDVYSFIRNGSF